jgi:hypothetical protein
MQSWTRAQKWAVVVGVVLLCLLLARPRLTPAEPATQLTATTVATNQSQDLPTTQGQAPSTIDPLTPQPDPAIDSLYLVMGGQPENCFVEYIPLEVRVVVRNAGEVAIDLFVVQLNDAEHTIYGLAAGQSVEIPFSNIVYGRQYTAQIDPADLVAERDESNNIRTMSVPDATPLPHCTATPPPMPSPSTQQPDLVIANMYLEMEGRTGGCMLAYAPYGIRVVVRNTGDADAPPFVVQLNGVAQSVANGLTAGQSVELHFSGTVPSGQYSAFVDPAGQVAERDESNNTQTFMAPTPTPPPLCTPAPTNSPTSTP